MLHVLHSEQNNNNFFFFFLMSEIYSPKHKGLSEIVPNIKDKIIDSQTYNHVVVVIKLSVIYKKTTTTKKKKNVETKQ